MNSNQEDISPKGRIIKCIVSAFVGMVIGLVISEVVANSLIEISITYVFSIVFGIAFILLGLALCWRIWKAVQETGKRLFLMFFALLVFISGIFSFLLETQVDNISVAGKIPMYAVVGISLSFALTFSLTEFLNLGLCDKCCNTDFESNPLIGTPKQIYILFVGAIVMGALFGIMFGTIDVENDTPSHAKFKANLLYSIPVGAGIGGLLGFINEWIRSAPRKYVVWSQDKTSYSQI